MYDLKFFAKLFNLCLEGHTIDKFRSVDDIATCDPPSSITTESIASGKYKFLLSHPEDILRKEMMDIFRTAKWNALVRHVVIDEAHCVVTWSEHFRPKYKELDQLAAIFPGASIVALTATATIPIACCIKRQAYRASLM